MSSPVSLPRSVAFGAVLIGLAIGVQDVQAQGGRSRARDRSGAGTDRIVLVEAFVSQGCDLCPQAEVLLSKLRKEFGPDRIAVVSYHVDYFNDPWKDPFSDPDFSARQAQYSQIYDREHKLDNPSYLYLTPLVIVDGQTPMVGSNAEAYQVATTAIRAGLAARPSATISLDLAPASGKGPRDLKVAVSAPGPGSDLAGQKVYVEVVTVEDSLSTAVKSGELAGRTYRADSVARAYDSKPVLLDRGGKPETLTFPITLAPGLDPSRCRLVVIVQDEKNGRVYQAATAPWQAADASMLRPSTPPRDAEFPTRDNGFERFSGRSRIAGDPRPFDGSTPGRGTRAERFRESFSCSLRRVTAEPQLDFRDCSKRLKRQPWAAACSGTSSATEADEHGGPSDGSNST